MRVYKTFTELTSYLEALKRDNKTIGFVPTMGALHDGHISLVKKSMIECDVTICSIFVNPTQFNNPSDLEKYPRSDVADLALLEKHLCHVAFLPSVDEVYPPNFQSTHVDLDGLDKVMEGEFRPGHFDGVVEVVWRFFQQINPSKAYFGEKDFQQLAVIKQLIKQKQSTITIVPCEILRENSGLALSSRNVRLSAEGKQHALLIIEQLRWAKANFKELSPTEIEKRVAKAFVPSPHLELEYFCIADTTQLRPVINKKTPARAFIAATLEGVRLIDNIALND